MQVEVSGTAAERLRTLVERGGFADESDAVAAAIESLWFETEVSGAELEHLVQVALDDVEAGRVQPLTRELAFEISQNGRARRDAGQRTP